MTSPPPDTGSTSGRCCFLTLEHAGDFVIDDDVALPALERAGWSVDVLPWRQRATPWDRYDVVVLRSTWDYWDDVPGFLAVLETIEAATLLANPLGLVRWNLSKTYLRDLAARGVATVPTRWHPALDAAAVADALEAFGEAGVVVKPQVGGNGDGVFRLPRRPGPDELAPVLARHGSGPCMVQPFRPSVETAGEASLFYFGGALSHAIRKRPAAGEFRSQEERGATIEALQPDATLVAAGDRAMAALPQPALYARVDLLPGPGDTWELVELELIEPSLYFRMDAGAPAAFADALGAWWRAARSG